MFRRRHRVLAIAATALAACATASKPAFPPVTYAFSAAAPPMGMRVFTYQVQGGGLFHLAASYRAGSADDPPGREGLAALVGRVSLRLGGGGEGRLTYSQRLLAAGVRFDARAGRDTLKFLASGPASRLAAALAVEVDRFRDPLAGVTDQDFRRERDLLAEELAEERLALRNRAGSQWLLELAVGVAPYIRPVHGTPESVRSLTLEGAQEWARRHFTPARLVVAATAPGSGTAREVMKAFGSLATGEADGVPAWARKVDPEPVPPFPLITSQAASPAEPAVRRAPVSGVQLWLAWVLPGEASVDAPRALAAVGLAEALVRAAAPGRETRETFTSESSYGFTLALARVDAEREEDARQVLRRLRKTDAPAGFRASWMGAYALAALRLGEYFRFEQPDVSFVADQARLTREPDPLAAWRRKVSAGLEKGFEEWVERWLDPRRAVALLVLPEKGREEPAEATPPEAVRRWSTTFAFQPRLPPGRYDVLELAPPPGLDSAVRSRLGNGLEVVVYRRAGFPRVEGRLVVRMRPAGTPRLSATVPHLALASARPSFSFVAPPSCPFADAEFHGDHFVAEAQGTSTRVEGVLRELACWSGKITADASLLDSAKKGVAKGSKRWRGTPELAVARALWDRLFPGWNDTWGEPAAIDAISRGTVEEWLESELRPDRATLILAGDVEPGPGLARAIEDAFGGWRVRRDAGPLPAAPPPPRVAGGTAAVLLAHRAGAKTALIDVVLRTPALDQRDLAAEEAWIAEVTRVLRRDRGEGGLGEVKVSQFERSADYSALFLETQVKAESAAWSLRRLLEALGGTAVAPAGEGMAQFWRWNLAIALPFGFETVRAVADRLAQSSLRGGRADFWERYRDSVDSLDGTRIQAVARSFSVGGEVAAVVGDREILEPQLRAAGFKVQLVEAPADPKKR